tara:strand:- start:17 stop:358 length:342 start_codon:yes stop_codon:yes gene_type:complete
MVGNRININLILTIKILNMGKFDDIRSSNEKNKIQEDYLKEISKIIENSPGITKELMSDPMHKVVDFLSRGKKKQAEKLFKNIRPKIKPEQYITEKQEEQILNSFLNEKDQII